MGFNPQMLKGPTFVNSFFFLDGLWALFFLETRKPRLGAHNLGSLVPWPTRLVPRRGTCLLRRINSTTELFSPRGVGADLSRLWHFCPTFRGSSVVANGWTVKGQDVPEFHDGARRTRGGGAAKHHDLLSVSGLNPRGAQQRLADSEGKEM